MNIIWDGLEIFGNEIVLTSSEFPNDRVNISRSSMIFLDDTIENEAILKTRFKEYQVSSTVASDINRLLRAREEDDKKAMEAAKFLSDYCKSRINCDDCIFSGFVDCHLVSRGWRKLPMLLGDV